MSLYSNLPNPSKDAESFLRSSTLFGTLGDEVISQIAPRLQRRSFASEVTLYHQDMPGMMLYMIEKGCVRVYSLGRTGQELTLNICGPGDILGELSSLDRKPHSATAITLTPTVVWLITQNDLEDLIHHYPAIAAAMIQILVARVRSTTNQIESLTFQDVQGRLAFELLRLAEKHGQKNKTFTEINVPLTQGDLATIVGAARESVNKAISHLRSLNLIAIDGTSLTILDPEGLGQVIHDRGR